MTRPVDLYGEIRCALAHPASVNMIGVDKVRADVDGFYTPDDDGPILAAIIAVMPKDEIIDLVAINLVRPDQWRRRVGLGDLLGEANTIGLNFTGEPLLVHPGPADWLNSACEGVAVLEFTRSVCSLLNSIPGGLFVADPNHAEMLERQLTEPAQRPQIFIRQRKAA